MAVVARSLDLVDLKQQAKAATSEDGTRADKASAAEHECPAPHVEFKLVTDRQAFNALESEWNELFERSAKSIHVFQSFNFCWHWANHYLPETSRPRGPHLSILTGRRNGRLIMIWPLVSERSNGITETYWMGEPVTQYGDALIDAVPDASDILRAGFDYLRRHLTSDVLRLRRVRGDSNVAPIMPLIDATIAESQVAPYMDLASAKDFAAFEERFPAKMRRNRRRLLRRLEEKGPVEFLRLHGGDGARGLAAQAIAVKSRWLKDRGLVSSALNDERTLELFKDLAASADKKVPCIISVLKTCGEAAAFEISFTCKGRLVVHVMAFELEHEKAGVGVLLLEQNLKAGYAENLDTYDMMAPGDPYKLDWCANSVPVEDWVKPMSAKGYLYARLYLGFLRGHLKSALKSMPKPVRRLLGHGLGNGSAQA